MALPDRGRPVAWRGVHLETSTLLQAIAAKDENE